MTSAGLDFDDDEDFGLADQGPINLGQTAGILLVLSVYRSTCLSVVSLPVLVGNTSTVQAASHKQASDPQHPEGGRSKAAPAGTIIVLISC